MSAFKRAGGRSRRYFTWTNLNRARVSRRVLGSAKVSQRMRNQKTARVFQLGWGDPAEKNYEITLYDEPVKGEERTAGTEPN